MNTTPDARGAWSIIPADCKDAMAQIERAGRMKEARPEVLLEAEAILKKCGRSSAMDLCFAINAAAERWLIRQGLKTDKTGWNAEKKFRIRL